MTWPQGKDPTDYRIWNLGGHRSVIGVSGVLKESTAIDGGAQRDRKVSMERSEIRSLEMML